MNVITKQRDQLKVKLNNHLFKTYRIHNIYKQTYEIQNLREQLATRALDYLN